MEESFEDFTTDGLIVHDEGCVSSFAFCPTPVPMLSYQFLFYSGSPSLSLSLSVPPFCFLCVPS
ncbi:hypothetical protein I7I50_10242 [Histoplasma capsulatum G186AR]|uniref:Uncharacterized protein n=1 Tax=Ajellomyces capsulatus TaxID=5037 RepID=A0A8H7Z655_AJECA|nr:hypothetical protein I7I52_01481 [Histoplasma capsulatum]QSS69068.1 hypothetical protein I7I50_10242 [Histoplasma capsulatum G186AR]